MAAVEGFDRASSRAQAAAPSTGRLSITWSTMPKSLAPSAVIVIVIAMVVLMNPARDPCPQAPEADQKDEDIGDDLDVAHFTQRTQHPDAVEEF